MVSINAAFAFETCTAIVYSDAHSDVTIEMQQCAHYSSIGNQKHLV